MIRHIAVLVATGLILAGCISDEPADIPSVLPESPEGVLRFLVIGDPGTGEEEQYQVADAMLQVCKIRGCEFVLVNGDNIYNDGVRSAYDQQFEDKFEKPYSNIDLPFWLVLGNHDNGNGAGSNPAAADHQVEYTYREDRTTDKWNMPARYYAFSEGPADFFGLDSGPQEVAQNPLWLPGGYGPQQEAWLEDAVASSTAEWKFAFAHHPYISNGAHGNAGIYDNVAGRGLSYRLMLENTICDEVDVFFAGHDHDLQWLEPTDSCGKTVHIVSGGAAKTRDRRATAENPALFEAYNQLGFLWVELDGDTFTGVFYDEHADVLFEHSFERVP